MTPVLRQIHWLPICQRIAYKLSLLVYKCLHNAAPVYLSSDCVPVSIIGRETTTAFLCQRHSGQSADKNCSWSSRVQSVRPCDVERPADRTAYYYCVSWHFQQTKLSCSRALTESTCALDDILRLFILRYTNVRIDIDWLIDWRHTFKMATMTSARHSLLCCLSPSPLSMCGVIGLLYSLVPDP